MHLKLLSGEKVTFHFRHFQNEPILPRTEVLVHAGPCHEKPCQRDGLRGMAFLHPNDQYDKAKGRKIALKRAIAILPRANRALIWEAYGRFTGAF